MPYTPDRLLVIWLATVFKVCGSPETNAIAFDSLREVARSLGKASSGQQRQRIEAGFLRLFDATSSPPTRTRTPSGASDTS